MIAYFENLVNLSGGLERTLCQLSNALDRFGHDVRIVTYDENKGSTFYPLSENIQLFNFYESNIHSGKSGLGGKLIRELHRAMGKESFNKWKESQRKEIKEGLYAFFKEWHPNVILSFNYRTTGELYSYGFPCPVISLFRNDPDVLCPQMSKKQKMGIEHSSAIQVLLPVFAETIQKYISNPKVVCIPNAISQCQEPTDLNVRKPSHIILNVARINPKQKRQEILVDAFIRIADQFPNWQVQIWGEGNNSYINKLQAKIDEHHLSDRICFMGRTHDVMSVYRKSDIFAFPSAYEGFPNALSEAMTSGLPSIVTDDCVSCKALIKNGANGLIVKPDASSFSEALKQLMLDDGLRAELGVKAHDDMKAFAPDDIWKQWNKLILQTAGGES